MAKSWLAVALLAVTLGFAGAAVAAAGDPMATVQETIRQVLSIVTDPSYKSATSERREKLREVIAPRFDFSEMARSAMGYHWRTLSPAQRDEFSRLFTGLLEASYLGKIEGYKGQKIEYIKQTQEGSLAQVNTNIVPSGGEPIAVNYRLKQDDGSWKVYDVMIDQISLVGNYRNQFNRIMNEKGYDKLVSALKQKQKAIDSGT
ncbi:MAG TPA: ABC transporter substrate-binding protein [Candidatus Binataceae bacterium]|nr:ABC transporter substrate-binding protein [Candidatus Binataceae bacterium]